MPKNNKNWLRDFNRRWNKKHRKKTAKVVHDFTQPLRKGRRLIPQYKGNINKIGKRSRKVMHRIRTERKKAGITIDTSGAPGFPRKRKDVTKSNINEQLFNAAREQGYREQDNLRRLFGIGLQKGGPLIDYYCFWRPGASNQMFRMKTKADVGKHIGGPVRLYRDVLKDEVYELGERFRNHFRRLFDRNAKQMRGSAKDLMNQQWAQESEDQTAVDRKAEFEDTGDRSLGVGVVESGQMSHRIRKDGSMSLGPETMVRFFLGKYDGANAYGWQFALHTPDPRQMDIVMNWEFRWALGEWDNYIDSIENVKARYGQNRYFIGNNRTSVQDSITGHETVAPYSKGIGKAADYAALGPIRKTKHETIDKGLASGGGGGIHSVFWKWLLSPWWKEAFKRIVDRTKSKKGKHSFGLRSKIPRVSRD